MKYITSDGVEFYIVPDCARCVWAGEHPDNMDSCPAGDDICRPDSCDYYMERDEADADDETAKESRCE